MSDLPIIKIGRADCSCGDTTNDRIYGREMYYINDWPHEFNKRHAGKTVWLRSVKQEEEVMVVRLYVEGWEE
jgi:hypothetical protein